MSSKNITTGTEVKNGRPTVLTPTVVEKLVEALKLGVTVEVACSTAGIHRDTYYKNIKDNPDFADKMLWATNYPRLVAGNVVMSDILKENVDSAKWWLEKKHSDEFGGKQTNIAIQNNIQVTWGDGEEI